MPLLSECFTYSKVLEWSALMRKYCCIIGVCAVSALFLVVAIAVLMATWFTRFADLMAGKTLRKQYQQVKLLLYFVDANLFE